MKRGVWYSDEEVCRAKVHQNVDFVQKQKRIVKAGITYEAGYFTVEMLRMLGRVNAGSIGADPDNYPTSENRWLAEHRRLKKLRATAMTNGKKLRATATGKNKGVATRPKLPATAE